MNVIAVAGLGIAAAAISVTLKKFSGEFGLFVSLAACVLILCAVIGAMPPLLSLLDELAQAANADMRYIEVLMKALAVCFVTGLAADCCRDSGESAIAAKIEFAGRAAVLLIAVPLFENVLEIVRELIRE